MDNIKSLSDNITYLEMQCLKLNHYSSSVAEEFKKLRKKHNNLIDSLTYLLQKKEEYPTVESLFSHLQILIDRMPSKDSSCSNMTDKEDLFSMADDEIMKSEGTPEGLELQSPKSQGIVLMVPKFVRQKKHSLFKNSDSFIVEKSNESDKIVKTEVNLSEELSPSKKVLKDIQYGDLDCAEAGGNLIVNEKADLTFKKSHSIGGSSREIERVSEQS